MLRQADPTDPSDEELVLRFQRDPDGATGRAALASLVERWSDRVYLWAHRMLREREAALDLAQDCLLRAIRALPRYQHQGRFAAWLFAIVHNRCRSVRRPRLWNRDPDVDPESLWTDHAAPDEDYESVQRHERLMSALHGVLDERERTALWLRAAEGMSVDDLTRLLAVPGASGARGLLQTARRKLRRALGPDGDGGG